MIKYKIFSNKFGKNMLKKVNHIKKIDLQENAKRKRK